MWKKLTRILVLLLVAASVTISPTLRSDTQGEPHLHWEQVTTDLNGNPANIEKYIVSCGRKSGTYKKSHDVLGATSTSVKLSVLKLSDGKWFCAVQAVNEVGASEYSEEVRFFLKAGIPVLVAVPAAPSIWIDFD